MRSFAEGAPQRRIAVIGLGKLGAPMAALYAARGHRVIGTDLNPAFVEAINARRAPVPEAGLAELIGEAGARLSATATLEEAVQASEASFIVVPTPSGPDGRFVNDHVIAAVSAIGRALRGGGQPHLVVITSTVMPGSTAGPIKSALETAAGRPLGPDLGLCYNPEFIALGSVIKDMRRPDFILIGESDATAGAWLAAFQATVLDEPRPVARLSLINAELAKIAVNSFVTMRISFANSLAAICEGLPGGEVDAVTAAIGLDSRIGAKYLRGGMGFGGPCFPRDNVAFQRAAEDARASAPLAAATDQVNRLHGERLLATVRSAIGERGAVALLGLSYKPGTPVIEASASLSLARALAAAGFAVTVHDPLAMNAARAALGESVSYAPSLADAVRGKDAIILATPWPEFASIDGDLLSAARPGVVVIDCWRMLDPARLGGQTRYIPVGAPQLAITRAEPAVVQ